MNGVPKQQMIIVGRILGMVDMLGNQQNETRDKNWDGVMPSKIVERWPEPFDEGLAMRSHAASLIFKNESLNNAIDTLIESSYNGGNWQDMYS